MDLRDKQKLATEERQIHSSRYDQVASLPNVDSTHVTSVRQEPIPSASMQLRSSIAWPRLSSNGSTLTDEINRLNLANPGTVLSVAGNVTLSAAMEGERTRELQHDPTLEMYG